MASITCGNCKATHDSVAAVKACYAHGNVDHYGNDKQTGIYTPAPVVGNVAKVTALANPATDKQQAFIVKLWGERYPDTSAEGLKAVAFAATKITKAEASEQINTLLALPNLAKAKQEATPSSGYLATAKKGDVHVVDGTYYRIHVGQTSGKPYACQAFISGEAQWAKDGSLVKPATVRWERKAGFVKHLSDSTKATPAQAAAFGKLVGRCCFCSHAIDTPESTAVGYGPVCAGNYGLPWGEAVTQVEAMA